jgi:pimeloyl-ACP methyl ester carboxylesterase
VVAFLDLLGIDRAVLVGHSMGSVIAQLVAVRRPEHVLGLVLVAAFAGYRGRPAIHELVDAVLKLEDPVDPKFVREFQESTVAHPVPAWYMGTVIAESLKLPARVWHAAFGRMLDLDDPPRSAITAPTLILWGDRDKYARRADQDALVAEISGARLTIHEGAGHALHWEDPLRFAHEVARFALSLRSAGGP